MASDRGSDLGTVIVAGAIGAAVGALVALLLAPKPGVETRAELGEKAKDAWGKAREKTGEVVATVKERICERGAEASETEESLADDEPDLTQA